jgi:hypothetical protein
VAQVSPVEQQRLIVPSDELVPSRWIDRLDKRIVGIATGLGFGLPVLIYTWLVAHYGVNMVEGDQWDDVTVIRHSYSNFFDWSSLWSQHNENRIFFPNLVVIGLSRTTSFNIHIEEYLSEAMLAASVVLVILTHRRRSPSVPWLYYCPVVLLMFSLTQYGNALWGFQMAWYLVLLALTSTIFVLDRIRLGRVAFSVALATALVGSFSSLQGLLIWPVGLVLLYHRRRSWKLAVVWAVVGVAAAALYLHNFNTDEAAAPHGYVFSHPFEALQFFIFSIGDLLGIPFRFRQGGGGWILLLGSILVTMAVILLLAYGFGRDETTGAPVGVSLIVMGLLFDATVTEGRVFFGFWGASASRYTTFDLLVLVGSYLVLLDRPPIGQTSTAGPGHRPVALARVSDAQSTACKWLSGVRPVLMGALVVVITLQICISIPNAINGSRRNFAYQTAGAEILRNIDHASDYSIRFYLSVFTTEAFIKEQARTLQKHHLVVFARP